MIAVIADRPELESVARRITQQLRSNGVAVTRAFRGNAKRQTERARKDNADAFLFVRTADLTAESVYLSRNDASSFDPEELRRQVDGGLHPLISGHAGGPLK